MFRTWFARRDQSLTPLAEAPVPKDLWVSREAEVVTYQPIPKELSEHHANLLFSGVDQGVRAPNAEILGGYIALIATNNSEVQTPPDSLDRMHTCL
jgi:hypothetical protein